MRTHLAATLHRLSANLLLACTVVLAAAGCGDNFMPRMFLVREDIELPAGRAFPIDVEYIEPRMEELEDAVVWHIDDPSIASISWDEETVTVVGIGRARRAPGRRTRTTRSSSTS